MTAEQKSIIKNMRGKLYSYTEIADIVGLPVNTVKSYCYRNRLNTENLIMSITPCKNCGTPIVSQSKTKPRVFCCDSCKLTWWKNNRERSTNTSEIRFTCPTCGNEFIAYKSANRKYCCSSCYQRRNSNGKN